MADLIPQDLAFADTAPVQMEGTAVVDGTPDEVWAVLVDHRSWPRWFGNGVTGCEPTSQPESGVGSTRSVALGRSARFDERFIAWDEPRLWAFTGTTMTPAAFTSLVERCTIEPLADGQTRVTYRMAIAPKGWLKPVVPLLRRKVTGALAGGMAALGREVVARRAAAGSAGSAGSA